MVVIEATELIGSWVAPYFDLLSVIEIDKHRYGWSTLFFYCYR